MDTIKKFAVLITGLLIILLVGWLLSISSKTPTTNLPPIDSLSVDRPLPHAAHSDSSTTRYGSGPEASQPSVRAGDSISWKNAKEIPREKEPPHIDGKMPMAGNPNPVFVSAARRIVPAVVTIYSTRRVRGSAFDFFHPFFKDKDNEENEGEGDDDIIQPGSGSGILISSDGYIMSNYHVIEGAEELRVLIYDKREYRGRVIGGDPTTDVALIKIDAQDLPAAMIGNSDSVQIGEWVMAVGNPLNFTSTVTTGIISALGRNINIIDRKYDYRIENFIQTDAVINPGNSGGALVNLRGEVIGMNTAIATRNGFYQGYGFAIPVNLAQKVVDDILKYGRVRRAILGVVIAPVDDTVARSLGLDKPAGALVQGLTRGSGAARAGIQQGDVILAVDGEPVASVNDLQIRIARRHPGEKVRLTIWRDQHRKELSIELVEPPAAGQPLAQNNSEEELFHDLGMSLRELSPEERSRLSLAAGLWVDEVAAASPAQRAGIFPTAILLEINGHALSSRADFEKILNSAKSGDVLKITLKPVPSAENHDSRIVFVEVP